MYLNYRYLLLSSFLSLSLPLQYPWSEHGNRFTITYLLGKGNHPSYPDDIEDKANEFLQLCFIPEQSERPTASELLGHTFVKVSYFLFSLVTQRSNVKNCQEAVASPCFQGQHSKSSASLQYSLPGPTVKFALAKSSIQASACDHNHLKIVPQNNQINNNYYLNIN